jgi:hypothetical protein
LNINNNLTGNKAVGVLGNCGVTAGTFDVMAEITAYFENVNPISEIRNNADVTLHGALVKQNAGFGFDLPLVALGGGRPEVAQNEAITLPLTSEAASGAKVHPDLNHTMLAVWWDYLPDLAG